jgi:pimeloyl-ACP methyl ester carboxylesterase
MVFVHGWSCDRSHFAPQVERFSATHRCIAVDLRGHGASDAPEQEYTIEGFADDVAAVCDELGVKRAVLVGHSMGGAVVLAMSVRRPDLVRATAMLDPAILFPPEAQSLVGQLASAFAAADGLAAARQFFEGQFFMPTSDPALKERLTMSALKTPQHVIASAFGHLATFDSAAALQATTKPLLYIGADPAITDTARLRELAPAVMVGKTVGAGHFHQLEVPEQINSMLERFMALADPRQPS